MFMYSFVYIYLYIYEYTYRHIYLNIYTSKCYMYVKISLVNCKTVGK